jgi:hypothetical protein
MSALQPPEGPLPPNDSNAPALLAIVGTFAGLAILSVLLRLWVRCVMLKTFGADDGLIIVAMLCGIGVLICWVGETANGLFFLSNSQVSL